jgi:hypothetical protein
MSDRHAKKKKKKKKGRRATMTQPTVQFSYRIPRLMTMPFNLVWQTPALWRCKLKGIARVVYSIPRAKQVRKPHHYDVYYKT